MRSTCLLLRLLWFFDLDFMRKISGPFDRAISRFDFTNLLKARMWLWQKIRIFWCFSKSRCFLLSKVFFEKTGCSLNWKFFTEQLFWKTGRSPGNPGRLRALNFLICKTKMWVNHTFIWLLIWHKKLTASNFHLQTIIQINYTFIQLIIDTKLSVQYKQLPKNYQKTPFKSFHKTPLMPCLLFPHPQVQNASRKGT
jgi:hypothetical protein